MNDFPSTYEIWAENYKKEKEANGRRQTKCGICELPISEAAAYQWEMLFN